jgi:Zn finger protein HypA/HybF involved in hydrogenase expression
MKRLTVKFRCSDCNNEISHEVTGYTISENAQPQEVKSRLKMYTPSFCPECGADDFDVIEFQELVSS